ncbi:FlgO family outer membrane protein [Roseospira visakhapatnamensis]|uniref:TolB-like protein n=1 Tax=Roseospira visakhapatnamensis TaxID=390880 RepID=A0A7W6W8R0_9PROT|nr:FlgO family outer membrane protein [Roseospira visakhapatnamensis]MBB4265129.1 TolB-like protein [Roseospira visakhapatnamensis]
MTMRSTRVPLLASTAAVAMLLVTACSIDSPTVARPETEDRRPFSNTAMSRTVEADITVASYNAVDQLVENAAAPLSADKPILVTTMVDGGDLTRSADLGRLISEQMASRLANAGYTVHELKLGAALKIREGTGELILTRDVRQLSRVAGAQAIIAGTYTEANSRVFVNARLVQAHDGRMLSAVDFELPRTRDVKVLLMSDTQDPSGLDSLGDHMQTYVIPSPIGH